MPEPPARGQVATVPAGPGAAEADWSRSDFQQAVSFRTTAEVQIPWHHQNVGLKQFGVVFQCEQPLTEFLVDGVAVFEQFTAIKGGPAGQRPADRHGHTTMDSRIQGSIKGTVLF